MPIKYAEKEIFAKICSHDSTEMLLVTIFKELQYVGVALLKNSDMEVINDITAISFHDFDFLGLHKYTRESHKASSLPTINSELEMY